VTLRGWIAMIGIIVTMALMWGGILYCGVIA